MVDYLSKDIVYVSSANRLTGTSSNFNINLINQITQPNQYDTISLLSFACPKSYYLINDSNKTFTIDENGTITTITLPTGNYSFTTMTTQLQTSLTGLTYTYLVQNDLNANNVRGKFTITVSNNSGIQPIITFSSSSPHRVLGFDQTAYTFSANILTSPNTVNFQLTNSLQLISNIVDKRILSTIIPDNADFSTITFNEVNAVFTGKKLVGNNISNANFTLINTIDGSTIDLNGLDYTFKFCIYKKNDFYRVMLNDKRLELIEKQIGDEIPKEA